MALRLWDFPAISPFRCTALPKAHRFAYDVVYTNVMSAGAYRGYGATQGIFAVESAVNQLAEKLHMDPVELRLRE